ncbi:ATP-dependent helicase [Acinetobacter qingfengensis]|uniref:DNA 3'-5' helicase n=1 Tax=Acinetobacter qingfengensis TaxID=1262585 RepID=A0A1E7RG34_9GAMM|nr:ATP-dependent helicase [Acinetobacter qingfengensis]OEY98125.1 ATP-dependent DNA helicase PcrA [Acinetobacter qingfengensis]
MTIQRLLDELNPEQLNAATTTAQNALILAGAGCGKTKTIVARAAYLINQGVPPEQIQIVTFTRRAASEIITRVEQYLGAQSQGLKASTFHTFCMGILRRYAKAFDLGQFNVIDRDDQLLMFRLLRGQQKDIELPKAAQLLDVYSFARNTQCKLSEALIKHLPEMMDFKDAIMAVMKAYEQQKRERGYLDYDDILEYVAKYLNQSDALLEQVLYRCQYLLVDEMQDTNPLQWSLLKPFIGKAHLFCVGDDAQSIYGFRGADFQNIHAFKQRVPDAEILTLAKNYRSTQEILDVSNWLLKISPLDYQKQLTAHRGSGLKPQLHTLANEFEEANWIAQNLKRRYQKGAAWQQHMILVRSGFAGRTIESALVAADIPYQFIGGVKLLESAHVKDVLSVLRIVANHKDELAWMRFLTLWNGIGDVSASRMATGFLQCDDLTACIQKLKKSSKVPAIAISALEQLIQIQHLVKQSLQVVLSALQTQLEHNYRNQDWSRRMRDFELVMQLADKHSNVTDFIEEYILEPISHSEVEREKDKDVVTLITIHSAKGTEREVCYVANASVGQFPHARSQGNFDEVEEERRVLYVALTRAKNELIITRQNLFTWVKDQLDVQGRVVTGYFLSDFLMSLCTETLHQRGEQRQRTWNFERESTITKPEIGVNWD